MNTKFLIVLIAALSLKAAAQLKKDDALLSFGMGYSVTKNEMDRIEGVDGNYRKFQENYFSGTARFGYFMRDGLAFGGLVGYTKTKNLENTRIVYNGAEEKLDYTREAKLFSIGPFLRAYKMTGNKKLAFFLGLEALYQTGKTNGLRKGTMMGSVYWGKDNEGKRDGALLTISPGFVWFMRQRLGIEVSIGNVAYSYYALKNRYKGKVLDSHPYTDLTASFGLKTVNVGLCFYLCERSPQK